MRPAPAARALAALLLAALAAPAAASPSAAPLGLSTPGPLRALFLDMPLADARGAPSTTVDVRWSMANSWSVPTVLVRGGDAVVVQLDAQIETLQLAAAVPWRILSGSALAMRLTTTVEARALVLWGGWSDGGIEGWHQVVSTTNFARQHWPRDRVGLTLAQAGGPRLVEVRSSRLALGDVALRTALRVAGAGPDEAPSRLTLALRLDLKLPAGRLARLGGSEGADAGLGAAVTLVANRWLTAHAMASLRAVSDLPGGVALQPRRLQGGLDLSLVARLGPVAVLLEDRVSSPLVENGWKLPPSQDDPYATAWYALAKPHNQLSLGLRWRELTASFSEDFTLGGRMAADRGPEWFYNSNAPDVVLGIAWARSL